MVESLQMFLFLFKSKYRRKYSWFSPFLCSVLIVLLFCHQTLSRVSRCSEHNCINGECRNDTCECLEGWQGPECQYCGGKVNVTSTSGVLTDGPGNYSVGAQCTWLLSPPWLGAAPPPLRVRLEAFATECGWDHVYIYDGDSVRAERLLAVFSGVLEPGEAGWTRQVIARSGSALVHFFSDDAYAMEGFNITYSAYSCPSNDHRTNCSDNGKCYDGTCDCDDMWIGVACDKPLCPDDCNRHRGWGSCTAAGCVCSPSRSGDDCGREASQAGWGWAWREPGEGPRGWGAGGGGEPVRAPPAPAGHALLEYKGDLLRVGGETFSKAEFLYRYNPSSKSWSPVEAESPPAGRFAHSAVLHGDELIVYGGVVASDDPDRGGGLAGLEGRADSVTNEVWRLKLDEARPRWVNATPRACSPHRPAPLRHCGGLHVSGHSAVVYASPKSEPVMLVFFGHSPQYGYLHIVQEYRITEGVWAAVATRGWPARAGFGHSAAYDALSGRVYVHGGLVSESEATQAPSAALFEYDPERRVWRPLPSAPMPRYLHTATFVTPGMMVVFGGNAHNDSAAAVVAGAGARCYSAGAALYHVRCKKWIPLDSPKEAARAAHAAAPLAVDGRETVIMYGGFDGRLRSDALSFAAGAACSTLRNESACVGAAARAARACVWRAHLDACVPIEDVGFEESHDGMVKACPAEPTLDERVCLSAGSCGACVAAGCSWCAGCHATRRHCARHARQNQMAVLLEECSPGPGAPAADAAGGGGGGAWGGAEVREACARYHSCAACHAHQHLHTHGTEELSHRLCYWDYDTIKCKPANSSDDARGAGAGGGAGGGVGGCSAACATYQSCANCTAEECIWCASAGRCVDKNAYGASFPLGGCRLWSTSGAGGGGGVSGAGASCGTGGGCGAHASCAACLAEPACGWCDDGAGGGRGACAAGGARGPHPPRVCPAPRWHFVRCPPCQCNGHAVCAAGGSAESGDGGGGGRAACVQPCAGRTLGDHCEQCAPGHWGNPLNGGECQPCQCNAQAVSCAPDTGRCHCSTKGLAGDKCDKCDNTNHYHADLYNKGACYYDLAVDYQFTFNLSKKEDRHLSAINFRNSPVKADVDADFSIACSAPARMNLTVRTRNHPAERTLFSDVNCTNFKYKFSKSEHQFGVEANATLTTFFVYVYDFRPPLWIQISFSQYPKLNLQQFFITFSSCFLLLLLVAAALWKIKQKYDLYRRRQRLFVEMEQMASRPFSQVCVELDKLNGSGGGASGGPPAPVALEPCRFGRAAVLSLLVRLPTGGTGRAPPLGGLAVASALVTLGHHATHTHHAAHAPTRAHAHTKHNAHR